MDINSPITGSPVSGFTSPTYTLLPMAAPNSAATQKYVSATGGTQPNVRPHTLLDPFTLTFQPPVTIKRPLSSTASGDRIGFQSAWPTNKFKWIGRKGVILSSLASATSVLRLEIDVPAGAEAFDMDNIKALLSASYGAAVAQLDDLLASIKSGA